MILVTANLGRKATPLGTLNDMRKIKRSLSRPIVGWQEIDEADPGDEHAMLKRVYRNFIQIGFKGRVPISVPRSKYRVLQRNTIVGSQGIPNVSPRRLLTEVLLQDRDNAAIKFVVINVHYPAGAFNKKIESTQRARENAWDNMFAVHKRRVQYWANKGVTVFWVGDVNRMGMPKVHPRERQVITAGIDSLSFIEGDTRVAFVRQGVVDLNSDHNAKWAEFRLAA